jgi:hypothetical protein
MGRRSNSAVVSMLIAVLLVANVSEMFRIDKPTSQVSVTNSWPAMNSKQPTDTAHLKKDVSGSSKRVPSTIDCFSNFSNPLPKVPSFIIAGAQKAGTSAIYYLLEQLPQLKPSVAFEAHFFDQRGQLDKNASALDENAVCQAREKYLQFFEYNGSFDKDEENNIAFEKTPVYLCKPEIPALVKTVTPWAKIIVILRNPIDRAYSAYRMARERSSNESSVPSFESLISLEIRMLRNRYLSKAPLMGNRFLNESTQKDFELPNNATFVERNQFLAIREKILSRGMYAQQLYNWLQHFTLGSDIKVLRYEAFVANRSKVLDEILEFVGARPHHLPLGVLQGHYRPTRGIRRNFTDPMHPLTHLYLERYEPYNMELVGLLGEEWRNVWW